MNITIRPLMENDLPAARQIVCLAFGTFLGAPEPEKFWPDLDYVSTRWRADSASAFGAEIDGELVGSNFATSWGSVGFFGPLTVHPKFWDQSVAKHLMEPILQCFERWGTRHVGLFTFAHSAKHVGLYNKYGFWPRFLTAIMSKPVQAKETTVRWSKYSELGEEERNACLNACGDLTDDLYAGLNVEREIRAVEFQGLGETVLLRHDQELGGFAICHCGPGTEAGSNKCYVKFGAARSSKLFDQLLDVCEALAAERGMTRLEAGVNLAREQAYRQMLKVGFRTDIQGVTMHRPNEPAYSRSEVYLIDDWR